MPWADPEKNAAAVRRWRAEHPGYWRRYERAARAPTVSRYRVLEEDVEQQRALFALSHRKADDPEAYRVRERRWIQATAFWSPVEEDDERGSARRRARQHDET